MYGILIKKIDKATLVSDGSRFLDVEFDILDPDGNPVQTLKRGFPLDTEKEIIKTELRKAADLYEYELKQKEDQKKTDEEDKNADGIIEELEGQNL